MGSEARYRTFVDFAADAFMVHTEDATVIDVNRQACENLGYAREELIGMKPARFDAGLDATGLQRVVSRVEAGKVLTFETRWRRKDGTVFPVEVRGRQFWQGARRDDSIEAPMSRTDIANYLGLSLAAGTATWV